MNVDETVRGPEKRKASKGKKGPKKSGGDVKSTLGQKRSMKQFDEDDGGSEDQDFEGDQVNKKGGRKREIKTKGGKK